MDNYLLLLLHQHLVEDGGEPVLEGAVVLVGHQQVSDAVQPALAQTGPPEGGGRVWRRARRAEAGSRRGEVAGVAAGQWIEWLLRQRRQGLLEFCATQ